MEAKRSGFKHVHFSGMARLEFLQLIKFPPPYERFTIKVKGIKTIRSGGFGIALGKRIERITFCYIFFTDSIYGRRASGTGGSAPFLTWSPRCPATRWDTNELEEMMLTFNSGRFRMSANGELRADFEDPHFDVIEVIAFAIWGGDQPTAEGWCDSFMIFGPSISFDFRPRGKLAVTWGRIKGG